MIRRNSAEVIRTTRSPEPPGGRSMWAEVVLVVFAVIGLFALAMLGLGLLSQNTPLFEDPAGTTPSLYEIARSAGIVAALAGAAVTATVALRRQKSTEEAARISARAYELDVERAGRDEIKRLWELYASSVGQLGSVSPALRLAAIHALAAVADDWLRLSRVSDAQTCIDILCSYLRNQRIEYEKEHEQAFDLQAETDIHTTITRVIGRRLKQGMQPSWASMYFNFRGASIVGNHELTGIILESGGHLDFHHSASEGGAEV